MLYSRKQLAELLNTSVQNIKMLEKRNKLKEKLENKGYNLIEIIKVKNKNQYEVENIEGYNEVLNNIYKHVFNTKDPVKFDKYFKERTNNINIPITLDEIGAKVNVSAMTVHNWDKTLIKNDIIAKDGFYYIKIDNATGEKIQVCKEEYNNYWKNRNDEKVLHELKNKYDDGTITFEQAITISQQISSLETLLSGCYYYKVSKYKLYEENRLYIDIKDMIEKGNKILEID